MTTIPKKLRVPRHQPRTDTAPASSPQNGAKNSSDGEAINHTIDGLDAMMSEAVRLAGCKDAAEFRKLPPSEQNDFLAHARGLARPEAQTGRLLQVALSSIGPSPWNRDDFDAEKLAKLVDDVKRDGIIQPLIVRRNPGYEARFVEPDRYVVQTLAGTIASEPMEPVKADQLCARLNAPEWELIAGERRWTAGTRAKLATAPIIVREADDRRALELQFIENDDREDLNALDEARKFRQLLDQYEGAGLTKTKAIEKLRALTHRSEGGIYERLSLLALPEKARGLVAQRRLPASHAALLGKLHDPGTQEKLAATIANKPGSDPMPFRETKRLVDEAVKREANLAEWQSLRTDFLAKHRVVLDEADNKKLFPYESSPTHPAHNAQFVKGDASCWEQGVNGRAWSVAMGKHKPDPVLARARDGSPVIVYPLADAKEAVKKNLPRGAKKKSSRPERDREHRARMKVFVELLGKVAAAGENLDGPELLRFIFSRIAGSNWDATKAVIRRREIKIEGDERFGLVKAMKDATGKELRGVIVELLFAEKFKPSTWSSGWGEGFAETCKLFGVTAPAWKVQTPEK